MVIIFNAAAFAQALLLAILGTILYFLGIGHVVSWLQLNEQGSFAFFLYLAFFVLAWMDRAGTKGRLFFIPTWLLCLIFIEFVMLAARSKSHGESLLIAANMLLPIYLGWRMTRKLDAIFVAKFRLATEAMDALEYAHGQDDNKTFWAAASNAFIMPSRFFLFGYPIFRFLNRNSVTQQEFVAHYLKLLDHMDARITDPKQKAKFSFFRQQLSYSAVNGSYSHNVNSLSKVAHVINAQNAVFK